MDPVTAAMGNLFMTDQNAGARPRHVSYRIAAAVLLVLPATACGSSKPGPAPTTAAATARPATVEQLAAKLGCTPKLRGKATDFRQAVCKAPTGNYVINTFVTEKNQQDWLDHSSMYGGTYLIGARWIIVATPQQLHPLRTQLGGRVHTART